MQTNLDHVGVAVSDLEEALRLHVGTLGMQQRSREVMERSGLEIVILVGVEGDSFIEVLAPTRDDDPVARFLRRHGPGLHHLAYRVGDLERAVALACERGLEMVSGIETGVGNSRTVFFHPRSTGSVLIELVERLDDNLL